MNAQRTKTPKITLFSFCIESIESVKKEGGALTHICDSINFFHRKGTIITKIKKKKKIQESTIQKIKYKRKYTQNEMSDAMKFFFCFKIAQLERSQSVNADTFYNQICVYICETLHYSSNIYCYFYSCCWCHCSRIFFCYCSFLFFQLSVDSFDI